ncbi:MAG: membrane dipeptidase, partial [Victivallaceae bacterium]
MFYIHVFFEFGVRMMHLTYNRRNLIGDGCGEPDDGGLSAFGRQVIAEMNRVGIIPDVAHCGQRTSLEAAQESGLPVVASHSACHSLAEHCRAKTDEVIEAIAKSGGYIGIV